MNLRYVYILAQKVTIRTERCVICRSHDDWMVSSEATQFAMAATHHGALSSDKIRSVEIKSNEVR